MQNSLYPVRGIHPPIQETAMQFISKPSNPCFLICESYPQYFIFFKFVSGKAMQCARTVTYLMKAKTWLSMKFFSIYRRRSHVRIFLRFFTRSTNGDRNFQFLDSFALSGRLCCTGLQDGKAKMKYFKRKSVLNSKLGNI